MSKTFNLFFKMQKAKSNMFDKDFSCIDLFSNIAKIRSIRPKSFKEVEIVSFSTLQNKQITKEIYFANNSGLSFI